MLLFWLKHCIPFCTLGALFGVSKSTAHQVVHEEFQRVADLTFAYVSMDSFFLEVPPRDFSNCYGIIDSTEMQINSWKDQAFSGKKNMHTLKYQAVVGVSSGKLLNIAGPYCGSMHDSYIFQQTNIYNWLQQNNGQLLGDKGYIGCDNIVTPYKKKKLQLTLTNNEREYNLNLASHRIKVEIYFCHLKK
jgi:hypothetical protein